MKRALLVGVPDDDPKHGLRPGPSVLAMKSLLEDLGGWSISTCEGQGADRAGILQALAALVDACEPEDTCLFYFFGHGGVVRFSGLPPDANSLAQRPVFYVTAARSSAQWYLTGVLDFELSTALARIDQICANVTAILDCCHSGVMVRDQHIPTVPAPEWVRELAAEGTTHDDLLAVEGHPRIVRLAATSSMRIAYCQRLDDGDLGWTTHGFVQVVREAQLRCDRLTWDAVAHRVREHAIQATGLEEQWVVLAGPRQRFVFSRETTQLPLSVGFVPGKDPAEGWLRAGVLQGVETGDRFGITALTHDEHGEPNVIAYARVEDVQLDRASVILEYLPGADDGSLAPGSAALLMRAERRAPVAVAELPELARLLGNSSLVRVASPGETEVATRATLAREGTPSVELSDSDGNLLFEPLVMNSVNLLYARELLEDRARAHRLLSVLAGQPPAATALSWRWGWLDPGTGEQILASETPPLLHVGDRIWIELHHSGVPPDGAPPTAWFVCIVEIGVSGRPSLLNTREPEGIELTTFERVFVGLRGHRRRQGLTLYWPEGVPRGRARRCTLIILASRRRIELGHLVRLPDPNYHLAFAAQGLREASPTRLGSPPPKIPALSRAWTWGTIEFDLDPRSRPGS